MIDLANGKGEIVHAEDLRGKWLLVVFGYTSCPDVCPTSLLKVAQVLAALGDAASNVLALFITIDPERDDPAKLSAYVKSFDDRIVSLSGKTESIAASAGSFGVTYFKTDVERPANYMLAHSSFISLVAPEGNVVARYSDHESADGISTNLSRMMR